MIIDEIRYILPNNNFVETEATKKQIILGSTFNHDMRHYIGWLNRYNGEFKRTASFTISLDGSIHQHFNPKFYSRYLNNKEIDPKTIVILLENDGWLLKIIENNGFYTWTGDIYNKSIDVIEKKWRGYSYWAPYSDKQFESLVSLVNKLCEEFSIPKTAIGHNTKVDDLKDYEGVLYKSNLDKQYTDLSPAFNFEGFKNKIEQI